MTFFKAFKIGNFDKFHFKYAFVEYVSDARSHLNNITIFSIALSHNFPIDTKENRGRQAASKTKNLAFETRK